MKKRPLHKFVKILSLCPAIGPVWAGGGRGRSRVGRFGLILTQRVFDMFLELGDDILGNLFFIKARPSPVFALVFVGQTLVELDHVLEFWTTLTAVPLLAAMPTATTPFGIGQWEAGASSGWRRATSPVGGVVSPAPLLSAFVARCNELIKLVRKLFWIHAVM